MLLHRVVGATARPLASLSTLSKAYNALPRFQRAYVAYKALQSSSAWSARTYATATATKTKKTAAKKKSTTTKKPAAKKKTTAKKTTAKKTKAAAKPKAVKKKKPKAAKKKVVKKKKKRVITPAAKARRARAQDLEDVKLLRAKSLAIPGGKPTSARIVFAAKSKGQFTGQDALVQLRNRFEGLSEIEKDELEVQAKQNKLANREAYEKWLSSHTAKDIKEANAARISLRKKLVKLYPKRKFNSRRRGLTLITDDRLVKRPSNPYACFFAERQKSGAFASQKATEAVKLIAAEFKRLTASDMKKYQDLAIADESRYVREHKDVYGEEPPKKALSRKTAA